MSTAPTMAVAVAAASVRSHRDRPMPFDGLRRQEARGPVGVAVDCLDQTVADDAARSRDQGDVLNHEDVFRP